MVHSSIVQDTLEVSIPFQLTLNDGADRAQIYYIMPSPYWINECITEKVFVSTAMLVYEWVIDMHNIYKYFLFVKTGSILVGSVCKQKKPPCFHMAEKGEYNHRP